MKSILLLVSLLAATMFTGCASRGMTYSRAVRSGTIATPAGKGRVVVYATKKAPSHTCTVYANGQPVTTKMEPRKFFVFYPEPGPLQMGSGGANAGTRMLRASLYGGPAGMAVAGAKVLADYKKDFVTIDVQPGATSFVEVYTGFGREKLRLVPSGEAMSEIEGCRLLPQGPWQGTPGIR